MLTNPRDAFRDLSRSPNMVPFHMLGMVSHYCPIITMSVRWTTFEIFNFKYAVTLKPSCHYGSLKVIEDESI